MAAPIQLDDGGELWPGEGDDNSGADHVLGGKDDDTIFGGDGDDHLQGQQGNDELWGEADNDNLNGGPGNDLLVGGSGNDELTGAAGADTFKFSFTVESGGEGTTHRYTEWLTASVDDGGLGLVDATDDRFNLVDGGTNAVGDAEGQELGLGTTQGFFSSTYTQWLESLGLTVLDLGQNSGIDGTPIVVEGPDGFGDRESFTWTSPASGKKAPVQTHERWYSDTWTSDEGQETVTSTDGKDIITDFNWVANEDGTVGDGGDILDFDGLTKQQFTDLFSVDDTQDVDEDSVSDTVITIDGSTDWSLTLLGVSGHDEPAFADYIFGL